MPGHPVHPVQPAQPTQSVHVPDPAARRAPAARHSAPSSVHPSGSAAGRPHEDPAGDVVRWAAFSCLLVPVVLVVYGSSFGGAAVATLGLLAVTAACRALLRQSEKAERSLARVLTEERLPPGHRGRRPRGGTAGRHGCRTTGPASPHD
ncbi:hypothetical protein [Streptomyces sp. NPDC047014]|uniref:hypothetical protein n=1 Tax=Streptomyces sp. NPDC047014 TaxID=3155736 RepID=UPI0033EBA3AC